MPLETDIATVRDFVTDTVIATWTDCDVTHEDPQMRNDAPVAWVRLTNPVFEPVTLQSDSCTVGVTVHGRWDSLTSTQKADKSSQLRAALLAIGGSLDGTAYNLDVSEFSGYTEDDVLDPARDVGLLFLCRLKVNR